MKDGKFIYSFHIQVDLFTILHHTRLCCKDLQQVAKFCDHVNLMFQISATWNWHTKSTNQYYSVDCIFVIVLLFMQPV